MEIIRGGAFPDAQQFARIAESVANQIMKHPMIAEECRKEGRTGGYFCLARFSNSDPASFLIGKVGSPNPEKSEKYRRFCEEKVSRLFRHPLDRLSRQSRDEQKEQWSGGGRGNKLIVAVSFLPEHADEIWSLGFLRSISDLSFYEAAAILDSHPNEFEPIYYDLDV